MSQSNPLTLLPDITNEGKPVAHWPPAVSAQEFCATPLARPPELIKNMLYQGGTMLLSGQSKAKKSWTLIDAAISIAHGVPWLGIETSQRPVLYLNFEIQDFAMQGRIIAVAGAKDLKPPRELYLLNLRNILTDVGSIEQELPAQIVKHGIGAVFIDPHYKISAVSGFEENSNDDQAKLLSTLEALCGSENVALVLAHHFSKGSAASKSQIDRASGGGVFARWPDVFMTLTEHEQEEAMTLEFTLRNFKTMAPFVVRWHYPLWRCDSALNPQKLKKRSGAKEQYPASQALEKLSSQGMTTTEWCKACGWSDGTFRRKRDELVNNAAVIQRGNKFFPAASSAIRVAAATGQKSQNRQNSQFTRQNSSLHTDTPTAIIFSNGGGGSGENEPLNTATNTHAESDGSRPATATFGSPGPAGSDQLLFESTESASPASIATTHSSGQPTSHVSA